MKIAFIQKDMVLILICCAYFYLVIVIENYPVFSLAQEKTNEVPWPRFSSQFIYFDICDDHPNSIDFCVKCLYFKITINLDVYIFFQSCSVMLDSCTIAHLGQSQQVTGLSKEKFV